MPYFDEIYPIYEEAFQAIERRSREGQRETFAHPRYRIRVIRDEETGAVISFLGYWELDSCLFLEHLATTEASRGKGHGRRLLEECKAEGREKGKPLFLEIEPVTEEDPMTGRREGFYKRCGFCTNSFYYEQMPLKEGDRPIPLWVMSCPEPVSEEDFLPYKKEIYQVVYKVKE
ncbi:MAG: GNAT family N-acetyltransferase [Lachnospiraceae bacterium]|nr:GNAT family N-acetyltransferase [Lachnospiraceae bacterium]